MYILCIYYFNTNNNYTSERGNYEMLNAGIEYKPISTKEHVNNISIIEDLEYE